MHELLLRVRAGIDLRKGTQLRVRTEDQIDTRAGPLDVVRLPIASFEHVAGVRYRLPLRAHIQQVDEEVIGQQAGRSVKTPWVEPSTLMLIRAQTTDQHRSVRARSGSAVAPCRSEPPRRAPQAGLLIVAEAVRGRFKSGEGMDIRLLLRGVGSAGRKGNLHIVSGILRGFLNRRIAADNDQVGERNFLSASL